MSTFNKILSSTPINSLAARQVQKGIHFEPDTKLSGFHSDIPEIVEIPRATKKSPYFVDLTGVTIGRITVLGLMKKKSKNTPAAWVCRCVCGSYSQHKSKTLKSCIESGNETDIACPSCIYLRKIKSKEYQNNP